jgi:hypothetical protein
VWPASGARDAVLCVAIGAQSIEAGILADGRWIDASLVELPIVAAAGLDGLVQALGQLPLVPTPAAAHDTAHDAAATSATIRRIRVVIADHWLCAGQVPFSAALRRSETATAFARACLKAAGSDIDTSDIVRIDDGAHLQPRLAVVYPARVIAALDALAQRLRASLEAVLPLSVAAWHACMPPAQKRPSALAVVDDGLILLATGRKKMLDVIVRRDLRTHVDQASIDGRLRDLWERARLRDAQWADVELGVLSLSEASATHTAYGPGLSPMDLSPRHAVAGASVGLQLAFACASARLDVDACAGRVKPNQWAWAAAAAIGVLSLSVMHVAWQAHREAVRVAQTIEQVNSAAVTEVTEPAWTREETSKARAINTAVRQLNLPFSDIVRALQPPRDIRVAVLGLEVLETASQTGASGPTVKVVAEAKTGAEMARYVGFLMDSRPFADAYLVHHEIVDSAGERPFRFTVEVRAKS